ncbi:MAG: signal peptide peptidase SppA, partial [Betaproteobacteria bacterium]|nr:signal peptide peptidase SppA [Betaproteobacteria bacterium]
EELVEGDDSQKKRIAKIELFGLIAQEIPGEIGSSMVDDLILQIRQAAYDDSVSALVIHIDSPGGSVYGVAELADEIVSARAKKPVVAIANSLAASAAYWIGCSASEFYVTPGGEVGSIGVWQAHQDYSKAMDEAGVKTTLISAGKFKVEGNPYAPLDEEAQGFMQSRVDDYYAAFTKAVAKGRGVPISQVRDGMGQGRVLGADAALASSMVDGIATFDDVVKKMRRDARTQIKPNASRLNQARNSLALM